MQYFFNFSANYNTTSLPPMKCSCFAWVLFYGDQCFSEWTFKRKGKVDTGYGNCWREAWVISCETKLLNDVSFMERLEISI
jgi:hypothetical protein